MASFMEATRASQSGLLYLVTAKEKPTGKEAWWYVLVHSKQIVPIFLKKVQTTGLSLTDYGDVLYSGWGKEPPEEIRQKVKEDLEKRAHSIPKRLVDGYFTDDEG